ncbi:Acetyltransferase (GNAT) domain-containing protein [Anaerocolumna jejuensis DSM 15929]|uniref:Acetyltransferase (GNAT) domain-containing protein n=1 Tax=Anaerocolumna jejuensis DSM 15929 TaxID=1121322 RepID=A0A1M7A5Y0_9FIRM|nr:GNAT family N-acetyltransferase [Anaerocolumna jejuensis]SHL38090.1 Acetyltransferase (GNAT) domain-containing protein [Anaerocolumna jejuensis DSM 15929]
MCDLKLKLETERLLLICETYEAMCLAAENGDELAKDFCGAYRYHNALADEGKFKKEDLIWYRTWTYYDKSDNRVIGGGLFKGTPNDFDYVEIGYGICDNMQSCGYATEGSGRLIIWALNEMGVAGVIAETEKDNIASICVLEKLGFEKTHETDEFYYWLKRKL